MIWQETLGLIGGALGNVGLIPQLWRLYHYKKADEISLAFLVIWLLSISCWLAYGILLNLLSVMIWNSITIILIGLMLFAKFKYGMK